ncbi:uncharacterized mitochondrial protein AtMg00820-like [Spinacia oleracea]|uniref:Uncharacterized mitochondrial protein AtMg00820-like n=1 Tax=Spinacia oleracea TaxID=3562 RepID=A0ABM3QY55_SPIOL|nr:uncharacterized mitochondrial protein AtMg00820-like [Spinacia oleracea]
MEYYTPEYIISLNNAMKVKEPVSYKHASKEVGWTSAMVEELEALKKNETWEWADLPPDKKALDSKWVYKVKHTREGDVERLKARLVTRGDKQEKGKDYKCTFSHVAKFAIVRILISLATLRNWQIQ